MLLRRITRALKEQNWFVASLEVAVVFLGVFIGLQADNWNEARITRANAKIYYARLADDLSAESTSRLARISYYERTRQHGEAALRELKQTDHPLGSRFLIDLYQTTQIWFFSVNRSTYDELLAAGISTIIPEAGLRARLANFYSSLEAGSHIQHETTPLRSNVRRFMPHFIQTAIRENCGDQFVFLENSFQKLSLPNVCDVELDANDVQEAIVELRSYGEIKEDLNRHLADIDGKISSLRGPLEEIGEVEGYLRSLAQ